MAASVTTRKQKRVSKNKKKNWRKHVNIDEIEEYFEDKRLQERTGGLVAEKSDESLFFIEKTSEAKSEEDRKSSLRKRRPAKDKPLKCYEKLQPDSSIKIPKVPRCDLPRSLKKLDKGSEKKVKRLLIAQKKKIIAQERKRSLATKSVAEPVVYDLWDEKSDQTVFRKKNSVTGKLDKDDDEYYLRQTRRMDIKIPNTGTIKNKPSAIPSVEVPHPGSSYNPSYDDHQALLQKAYEIELLKEKKEKKITRALDEFFPDAASAPTDASRLKEMSVGIFSPIDEGDDEEQVVSGGVSYNPPVRREDKKTITQRNKERRLKEKLQKRKEAKENKSKKGEIFKLKQLKRNVNFQQKKLQEKLVENVEKKKRAAFETRKLGKLKFEAPDLELKLGEELEGSLRLMKPEGNLLSDRFKSLQKRNLIETRVRAKNKRKYKAKEFEKKTHKEVTL